MKRARGFALMLALFLLVSMSAIGAYLLTVSTGQLEAGAQDERATQAYFAARSGIEWAAYRVLRDDVCPGATSLAPFGTFVAQVTCTLVATEREGNADVRVFNILSTGCSPGPCGTLSPTYVERQLELRLSR